MNKKKEIRDTRRIYEFIKANQKKTQNQDDVPPSRCSSQRVLRLAKATGFESEEGRQTTVATDSSLVQSEPRGVWRASSIP